MLRGLHGFFDCPSFSFSFLKLFLQLQDLLLLCGELYLSEIELPTLVLNLVLGILQASLSTLSRSILGSQLSGKFLTLLFGGAQGPVGLNMEIGLSLSFISGIFDPLLCHRNLLNSLHMDNKEVR